MGVIRGFLLVIIAVLLFLSIVTASLFWTLSLSLNYDNVQKQSTTIIKDFLGNTANISSIMSQYYPLIKSYCQNHSNLSYVFSSTGYTFDIPCSSVANRTDKIIEAGITSVVSKFYYKQYNCSFLDCFVPTEPPLFLISEKTHNFLLNKAYFFLVLSVILSAGVFLLIQKKSNWPIVVGAFFLITFLLFVKLDYLLSMFSDKMISKFLAIFFAEAYTVSVYALVATVVLLLVGIVLKIFKIGFFIEKNVLKFGKLKEEKKKKQDDKKDEEESNKKENKNKKK
jgi:hypothetical protein